jgi:hypothetical protein
METKRLGKLFDEWKATQEDEFEESYSTSHSRSARPASLRLTDETGWGRSNKAGPSPKAETAGADGGATPSATPAAAAGAASSATTTPKVKSSAIGGRAQAGAKGRGRGQKQAGSRTGSPLHPGGKKGKTGKQRAVLGADVEADCETQGLDDLDGPLGSDYGSDTSEHRGAGISESKLVSRFFQVVTNPKVTGEASGDGENTRRVPSYVEGFPTLNLMRLYRGPWRLEP